jgi:hypothetical protein
VHPRLLYFEMPMIFEVNIQIPDLWGNETFHKSEWGAINYFIGPNGSGKTRFSEQIKNQFQNKGINVRYLSSERLSGLEKQDYTYFSNSNFNRGLDIGQSNQIKSNAVNYGLSSSAFLLLKERLDIRIKIEAILSIFFNRKIKLDESGGFLSPKLQKIDGVGEYSLKQGECHGLKELITLLTLIYHDEYRYIIIDEPELHLHPQFQSFLLNEIRKNAGDPNTDPGKKCFFIATHSPYFVEIRSVAELKNCIIFQPDKLPRYIDNLEDSDDEYRITRLLPRLNTHHKQFFFATRPIFVEGYFDQQVFTLIEEKREKILGSSGTCFIDVGGKEELDLFFRLCRKLNINAQFITDLDLLFEGKLRQTVLNDSRCSTYIQTHGINNEKLLGELEQILNKHLLELSLITPDGTFNEPLKVFLSMISREPDEAKKRNLLFIGLMNYRESIQSIIPKINEDLPFIDGRISKIFEAFKQCGVYILPKGALENHFPEYEGNKFKIEESKKRETFERVRNFILDTSNPPDCVTTHYKDLSELLDLATRAKTIDMNVFLTKAVRDWIFKIQMSFN